MRGVENKEMFRIISAKAGNMMSVKSGLEDYEMGDHSNCYVYQLRGASHQDAKIELSDEVQE